MTRCVLKTSHAITSIAISGDLLIVATLQGYLAKYRIVQDRNKLTLRGRKFVKYHQSSINSIAISENLLVTASRDGEIQFHLREGMNTTGSAKFRVTDREIPIFNVRINKLETKVIACCENGTIMQWDTSRDEGESIFKSNSSCILTGQFSPDSPFIFASGDSEGIIRIHDLREDGTCSDSSMETCSIRTLTHLSGGNYIFYATLNDTGKDDLIGLYDVRKKSPVDTTLFVNSGGLSCVTATDANEAFLSHESGLLSQATLDTEDMRVKSSSIDFELNLGPQKFASYIDLCPQSNLLAACGWNSLGGEIAVTDASKVRTIEYN